MSQCQPTDKPSILSLFIVSSSNRKVGLYSTSLSSISSSPSSSVFNYSHDDDESSDSIGTLKVSRRVGGVSSTSAPFTPLPLKSPSTLNQRLTQQKYQRTTTDPGPVAGRIAPPVNKTTLFPITTGSSPQVDSTLLQHGLAQILATKDSAKNYIELLRKKMLSYMVLNKEMTTSHVKDQMRQKGIDALKKSLAVRIQQMEVLRKNINQQVSQKEAENELKLQGVRDDLQSMRDRHNELHRSFVELTRSKADAEREHSTQLEQLQAQHEQEMEEVQRVARLAEMQNQTTLSQSEEEKAQLQARLDQMEEENGKLKMELRISQARSQESHDTANTVSLAQVHRLEIALENACNEVVRLESECSASKSSLTDAIMDIHKLVDHHARMKKMHEKLHESCQTKDERIAQMQMSLCQLQIELDEARDIGSAYEDAYEATLRQKNELETGMQQLIRDFELLRDNLCELMIEQGSTIPLPLSALDTNPELSLILATAGVEPDEREKEEAISSSSNLSLAVTSTLSEPPLSLKDLESSMADLNLSQVTRRLSLTSNIEPHTPQTSGSRAKSRMGSTHSTPMSNKHALESSLASSFSSSLSALSSPSTVDMSYASPLSVSSPPNLRRYLSRSLISSLNMSSSSSATPSSTPNSATNPKTASSLSGSSSRSNTSSKTSDAI